ncbi:MAG: hypothetical protein M1836_005099 [Candelina mexicana]|nr:MAG: hypothetical protein M1836_005099 [Candelina mexicana]
MPADKTTYKEDVNFQTLALQFPSFAKHLKPNGQLDFTDPETVQFNYILWIQSLLDTTSDSYTDKYDPNRDVIGLDIPKWRFGATDIDDKSLYYARENIARNNLNPRIRLLKTTPEDPLIPLQALGLESIDFTICNPPFYSSTEEMLSSANAKQRPPFSACTGTPTETVTPGGEISFTLRLLHESHSLRTRVQWYTTLLGKLSSVSTLIPKLKQAGVDNYAVTEFVQGSSRTRRWGLAWSWGRMRARMDVARNIPSLPRNLLPFPSIYVFSVSAMSPATIASRLNTLLSSLDLQWQYRPSIATGIGFAAKNVWSRASRRLRQQRHQSIELSKDGDGRVEGGDEDEDMSDEEEEEEEAALGFKIEVVGMKKDGKEAEGEGQGTEVRIRWLKGKESVLFESFCGMVRRKLTGAFTG